MMKVPSKKTFVVEVLGFFLLALGLNSLQGYGVLISIVAATIATIAIFLFRLWVLNSTDE